MTLQDILTSALILLDESANELTADKLANDKNIALLAECVNMTLQEIAVEYVPAIKSETLNFTSGKLSSKTSEEVWKAIKVEQDGVSYPFNAEAKGVIIASGLSGRANVTYRYLPAKLKSLTTAADVGEGVMCQSVALGACARYCMIRGLYEQSAAFLQKFEFDMRTASRPRNNTYIKRREWY